MQDTARVSDTIEGYDSRSQGELPRHMLLICP